ncbi:hypothetical protein HNR02_002949 [Amycolatopsis endophytica]|uniref:LppX_LprAFG lipoprotein n=1 Tax=Amycolatopsis endophytica TaxID=860233 RepID=A0A853B4U9_9PSEU|nr:hypothetical protein [Amycolatopsis endophytica]NYI89626.1 hypothetical protein [Amycolatopsis endophytica]
MWRAVRLRGPRAVRDARELVRAASAKADQVRTARFTMTMSMAGEEITGTGEGTFTGPDTAMALTVTTGGRTAEMRVVDEVIYFQLPEDSRSRTGGKPWATLPEGSEAAKSLGTSIEQAKANNPAKTLEQVRQAGTIDRSELTTLDGQQVSHYWVTIDVAKAGELGLMSLSPEQRERLTVTFPMELWLDADQLPVQVTQNLTSVMQASGAPAELLNATTAVRYRDWGAPITVEAPPADQVGELAIG